MRKQTYRKVGRTCKEKLEAAKNKIACLEENVKHLTEALVECRGKE